MSERRDPTAKKDPRAAIRGVSTGGEAEETRVTYMVNREQQRAIKIHAALHGMLIKDVVAEAFAEYLANHPDNIGN